MLEDTATGAVLEFQTEVQGRTKDLNTEEILFLLLEAGGCMLVPKLFVLSYRLVRGFLLLRLSTSPLHQLCTKPRGEDIIRRGVFHGPGRF